MCRHSRSRPTCAGFICSDGLSDLVDNETLSDLLQESEDSRAAFELWKAAIEAGGHDNITLTLVRAAE
jgi:serine/threonine protein phosphatase PrpC